jgi:hypothetical protein
MRVEIYKCDNCGVMNEVQYDSSDELVKEVIIYKTVENNSAFTDMLTLSNYQGFSMDKLWEICGDLCYPILMQTEFSTGVDLYFVPVGNDLSQNSIQGYLVTPSNVLTRVCIRKSRDITYFTNPYLFKLPHNTFLYATHHVPGNTNIMTVNNIRYRQKIVTKNGLTVYELYIIQDFPVPCYGIEVFVKFCTLDKTEYSIYELMQFICMDKIILGETNIETGNGFYIQSARLSKVTLYTLGSKSVSMLDRKNFYNSVMTFFELIKE